MSKKIRIAATGLDGLVGSRVNELLEKDFDFIPLSQTQMDISKKDQVNAMLKQTPFDMFLHLAAYTNVDGAEREKQTVWDINVTGTTNVFEAVTSQNKPFIYISTDFVFDGRMPPFFEDSTPNPISYYGQTKYEGEKIVQDKAMIVRLSYPYRTHFENKTDIVRSIINALKEKKHLKGVIDQIMTFTFIDDIVYALKHLFKHFAPEIFHIVGGDNLTAYDAILAICDIFGFDKSLVGKTTYQAFYHNKTQRPKKGIIKSKKNNFYQMKTFEEGLKIMKKQLYF